LSYVFNHHTRELARQIRKASERFSYPLFVMNSASSDANSSDMLILTLSIALPS
jgi:hypothetical protein